MPKTPTGLKPMSFKLPPATVAKLKRLAEKYGSMTTVLIMAVDKFDEPIDPKQED